MNTKVTNFANSFIPVIIGIYLIKTKPHISRNVQRKILFEIVEGLKYIRQSSILRSTVLTMLSVGTFVMNFNVIIPLYAAEVLNQGINGYGFLLSANGAGSLLGALVVASWAKGNPKLRLLFASGFLVSAFLILLQPIHILSLSAVAFAIIGFFNILFATTANSTIQINSSEQFRGRVMSVYTLAFAGTTPIGNLFAGSIIQKLGAGLGIAICGAISAFLIILIIISASVKKHPSVQIG